MIGDEPRRLQLGADLGDMSADIGMVGERLSIAFRPARVDHLAQFVECRLCYPEIDWRVRAQNQCKLLWRRRLISSERNSTALSGTKHSSRIRASLRVARIPRTSQFGSTRRPAAPGGSRKTSPAIALAAPSREAPTITKSAASIIEANILRPVKR